MDRLLQDFRFSARLLWKNKGYSATAIATLAICLGANTAIFSVIHCVVLRPLPFEESDGILLMYNSYPGAGVQRSSTGAPDYFDRLKGVTVFEEQALYQRQGITIGEAGSVQQLRGMGVTPSFFRLLRVKPRLGRIFSEEEGEVGRERKAILTHALWQELYGGDEAVLGKDIRIYGNPYTIVGIMPEGFSFLDPEVRLYRPLAFTPEQKSDESRHSNNWDMIGRLKPGATREQAQAQVDAVNAANMERFPRFRETLTNVRFSTRVVPLQDEIIRDIRATLYLLWGGAAFVLLIGVINIANLAMARGSVRLKELATRSALGAGRWCIVRHVISESLLLTVVSAALGLLLGSWGLRLLRRLQIERIPRGNEIVMDATVLAYVLGMSVLVVIAVGSIPALQGLRANLSSVFRKDTRTSMGGRNARLLRNGLIAAQVAFALVLLMGCGLLIASFRNVLAVRPGFSPEQVATGSVALPAVRYQDASSRRTFVQRSLEKIRALPNVVEAGVTDTIPFGGRYVDIVIQAEGYIMKPGESQITGDRMVATRGYFEAMRIPLIEGRFFEESDTPDSPSVIIIDERLARRFWQNGSPVGKRMWCPPSPDSHPSKGTRWFAVVGVVGAVKLKGLVGVEETLGSYYFPYFQSPNSPITFAARTAGDPGLMMGAIRKVVAEVDPELPFYDTRTMQERIDNSLTDRRSPLVLSISFGLVALFLAGVGIYGVISYQVAQRFKEIGVRMALGGDSGRIFRLFVREGLMIILLGIVFGALGSWMLSRYIESVLYGVRPLDPVVLASVGITLLLVAFLASTLPALRATRVDPIAALRQE